MTPKQSLTRKQSLIRRSLAVLGTALLATAWVVGISTPAGAAPVKGSLKIVSVTNADSDLEDLLVQGKKFDVKVTVLDTDGQPMMVNQATRIRLEAEGPGTLRDTTTATIPRNGSSATIFGATYSQFANGVKLRVLATSGVELAPGEKTVDFALTAVKDNVGARGNALDLDDPGCGDGGGVPTSKAPTCGHLLTKGAVGLVVMSVGSCVGLSCNTAALAVTVKGDIQATDSDPYSTMILGCDKVVCGGSGVPKIPVKFTFENDKPLTEVAPECPAKGVIGDGPICVDYVQSTRSAGDLYTYVLFKHDVRFSH
jgi:hypothetical protein